MLCTNPENFNPAAVETPAEIREMFQERSQEALEVLTWI